MVDPDVTGVVRHEDPKVGQWERYTAGYRTGLVDKSQGTPPKVVSRRGSYSDLAWAEGYLDGYELPPAIG